MKPSFFSNNEFHISRDTLRSCDLCPRTCRVDRLSGERGFCGCGPKITAARAALHFWEEPCISGEPVTDTYGNVSGRGSGTVFFSGCTLHCRFCQNSEISFKMSGKQISVSELSDIFLRLQDAGAYNINLVTATQFLPEILPALDAVKGRLLIPVVYNCGGYERVETVKALKDYVDIWLPDFKYFDSDLSHRFSGADDYFKYTSQAITQMLAQTGSPVFHMEHSGNREIPIMDRGVIIRHMVIPGHRDDSIRILKWIAHNLPRNQFYISLMSQFTPYHKDADYPELNRRLTSFEYQKVVDAALELGLDTGFMQEKSSAKEEYTPAFDCEGL